VQMSFAEMANIDSRRKGFTSMPDLSEANVFWKLYDLVSDITISLQVENSKSNEISGLDDAMALYYILGNSDILSDTSGPRRVFLLEMLYSGISAVKTPQPTGVCSTHTKANFCFLY
jgi:hypothetical protein